MPPKSARSRLRGDSGASSISIGSRISRRTFVRAEEVVTYITIPPDGGWGWVIVTVAFYANFLADGSMMTYSIFKPDLQATFNSSDTQMLLPSSMITGLYYLAGPFACATTNRFGFRITGISGALIVSAGYLSASFVKHLVVFIIIYGVVIGIGFSMLYAGSMLVVGFYFEKWRALATSIAVCGSSCGVIFFPIIFTGALSNFTWQTKYRILSGISLSCAAACFVFKPVKPVQVVSANAANVNAPITDDTSVVSFPEDLDRHLMYENFHNVAYPTNAEVHSFAPVVLKDFEDADPSVRSRAISVRSLRSTKSAKSTRSGISRKGPTMSIAGMSQYERLSVMIDDSPQYNKFHKCMLRIKAKICCCCMKESIPSRPLYRDDIMYPATLANLPQYDETAKEEDDKLQYHMKVTRVTTLDDVEEHNIPCLCCPESIKRALATLLDLSLLKNIPFMLMNFSAVLTIVGYYLPFLFMAPCAESMGIEKSKAEFLLSVIGIANTVGRVVSGVVSSIPKVKATPVSIVGLVLSGVTLIAIPFYSHLYFQYAMAAFYGLFISVASTLRTMIICEIVGLENLTNAFGIFMLLQGVGCLAGIPLGGVLVSATGDQYVAVFVFAGSVILVSGLLLIPLGKITRWDKKRKDAKAKEKEDALAPLSLPPKSELKSNLKSESKFGTKSDPKSAGKSNPKGAAKSEPKGAAKSEPKSAPKTEPKYEPKSEPKDAPKSEPKAALKTETKNEDDEQKEKPELKSALKSTEP